MSVYSIISARGGSKGFPKKNIKLLGGYPLIAYSIIISKLCPMIERTIVSTDSQEIAEIAKEYGAEVPFLRPEEISGDHSSDLELMNHALGWMQSNEGNIPEFIVHLRPTTPLREACYIETAIETIKKDNKATALRSLHEMTQTAYKCFEMKGGYLKSIYSGSFDIEEANRPRQEFAKTYDANGYVDIIRTSYVLKNKKIHGDLVIGFITPFAPEIDSIEDFDYIKYQISKNNALIDKYVKTRDQM